jgi:lipopolysaccharide/colanic/teichoic acid biosynthesis glycosyltransferase
MTHIYKVSGNATTGDILAFICSAVSEGADAAVAASSLPVLTRHAGCQPQGSGECSGAFVFHALPGARAGCGLLERALAALLLLLLFPVLAAAALLLFLFEGAPVMFRQERYGREGAPFPLLKFRTMMRRSELLHEKLQLKLGTADHLFKLEHDPRVTRIGRFMRNTFLDELPQLVNILIGDMSIVGPRPLVDKTFDPYPEHVKRVIYNVRPGLTGIGSIVFRDEERLLSDSGMPLAEFYAKHIAPAKGELELWYQRRLSFRTDMLLIFLTAWVIAFPKSRLLPKVFKDLPEVKVPGLG